MDKHFVHISYNLDYFLKKNHSKLFCFSMCVKLSCFSRIQRMRFAIISTIIANVAYPKLYLSKQLVPNFTNYILTRHTYCTKKWQIGHAVLKCSVVVWWNWSFELRWQKCNQHNLQNKYLKSKTGRGKVFTYLLIYFFTSYLIHLSVLSLRR